MSVHLSQVLTSEPSWDHLVANIVKLVLTGLWVLGNMARRIETGCGS